MERHLEPMSATRDWRLLLCDAVSPQLIAAVRRLAWRRGYIVCIHGGGVTSVVQPNDTDLHLHLRRLYTGMEMEEMLAQHLAAPRRCPAARPAECIAWMAAAWRSPALHAQAAQGFWSTGLANALDGSEDALIVREAGQLWQETGMAARRDQLVRDVTEEFERGDIAWSYNDVARLIQVTRW